jgi:hypothetical protein
MRSWESARPLEGGGIPGLPGSHGPGEAVCWRRVKILSPRHNILLRSFVATPERLVRFERGARRSSIVHGDGTRSSAPPHPTAQPAPDNIMRSRGGEGRWRLYANEECSSDLCWSGLKLKRTDAIPSERGRRLSPTSQSERLRLQPVTACLRPSRALWSMFARGEPLCG